MPGTFDGYSTSASGNFILLGPGSGVTLGPLVVASAQNATGAVYSTVSGVALLQQSFDGQNWDVSYQVTVTSGSYPFNQAIIAPYVRLVYTNGSTQQADNSNFRAFLRTYTTGM